MYSTETIDRLFQTKAQACLAPPQPEEAEHIPLTPIEEENFAGKDAALCSIIEMILKNPFRLRRLIRVRRSNRP